MLSADLPDAAAWALWFTAWVSGWVGAEEAMDGLQGSAGPDAPHRVAGLPGEAEPVPLLLAWGRLRTLGATGCGLALPRAGDPLGLAGPSAFNAEAIDAGEAAVLTGTDLGVVPQRTGRGVVWHVQTATSRRQLPHLPEAAPDLRLAVVRCADALAALDVAAWRPEVADALMGMRRVWEPPVPPGFPGPALRDLGRALALLAVVELALADDGAAVSASEAAARREVLLPLDAAARRVVVAACSLPAEAWTSLGAGGSARR